MKQCSCCLGIFSTGQKYGDFWTESKFNNEKLEKGLCEFCNHKHASFCCDKHGLPFKIGVIEYLPK